MAVGRVWVGLEPVHPGAGVSHAPRGECVDGVGWCTALGASSYEWFCHGLLLNWSAPSTLSSSVALHELLPSGCAPCRTECVHLGSSESAASSSRITQRAV